MTTLEDFDSRQFGLDMRILERSLSRSALKYRAEENALVAHRVTSYVKSLPVDDPRIPLYPAISYHQLTDGPEEQDAPLRIVQDISQDLPQDISRNIPREVHKDVSLGSLGGASPTDAGSTINLSPELLRTIPGFDVDSFLTSDKLFIAWSLPAHDLTRPDRKGCGFIRSKDGTPVYTACPHDHDHFLKAKRAHCWSLHCPDCMNDTALRNGARTQDRFDEYIALTRKETGSEPRVSHFVVSPPQEMMKVAMQTYGSYDAVVRYIESQLISCGGLGGDMIFHPWRQRADRWELSPHFHCLLFGFIDTRRFLRENPGWIIKKIHARERIRSIRHTMGYLQTHCGLARIEVNPDSVDWESRILSHFIPGFSTGKSIPFTDQDYELMSHGKGRMVGDISDMDWVQWTMDPLGTDLHHRYWGALASKSIVKVDSYRQYRIRVCRECGCHLRTYDGFGDQCGDHVRYIVDNPVVCFARNAPAVRGFFLRFKSTLRDNGMDAGDLAAMIPVAVSPREYRDDGPDLIMDGPFEEPDEFFLERQRKATMPSD